MVYAARGPRHLVLHKATCEEDLTSHRVAEERPDEGAVPDNTELVNLARSGDRKAFGILYERYARAVHGILLANVETTEVGDLMQDVFLTAMQQLPKLREAAAFGGWLVSIARNRAKMHHRAARPFVALAPGIAGSERSDASIETEDILQALRQLPERYREPLMLRLIEELNGSEIAQQTGLSHGTVRVYLHHGMRLLRDSLGDAYAG